MGGAEYSLGQAVQINHGSFLRPEWLGARVTDLRPERSLFMSVVERVMGLSPMVVEVDGGAEAFAGEEFVVYQTDLGNRVRPVKALSEH